MEFIVLCTLLVHFIIGDLLKHDYNIGFLQLLFIVDILNISHSRELFIVESNIFLWFIKNIWFIYKYIYIYIYLFIYLFIYLLLKTQYAMQKIKQM